MSDSGRPGSPLAGALIIEGLRSATRGPFSAHVGSGECVVVTGPSGIGKSLFLRMIADLDPNTGMVRLDGRSRDAMPAPRWRALVTYVAADAGWWDDRVADHMPDRARAAGLMEEMGLAAGLLAAPVAQLSTGERQRAALVRALAGQPRVVLLDEPTSALDTASKRRVEAVLSRLQRDGLGLVVVSHDADQAERIADRRYIMSAQGLSPA